MSMPVVFISYSHKDEAWKNRLLTHLRVLAAEGQIDTWDDRRIEAGSDWRREIGSALESARVYIPLLSADFLTSPFIRDQELPSLLRRHQRGQLQIIPLLVRACPWRSVSWLHELQIRPSTGRPLASLSRGEVDG